MSYLVYVANDWRIEERLWGREAPVLVLGSKLEVGEVPRHASHGDGALAIWRPKIEIKGVILDILIASAVLKDAAFAH